MYTAVAAIAAGLLYPALMTIGAVLIIWAAVTDNDRRMVRGLSLWAGAVATLLLVVLALGMAGDWTNAALATAYAAATTAGVWICARLYDRDQSGGSA